MKQAKFEPRGQLALAPEAFGVLLEIEEPRPVEMRDGVAILAIRGPLMHHESALFDSYDAIKDRATAALIQNPSALVLIPDTPGGLVAGMLTTAQEVKRLAAIAGVPIGTYVDGMALSAGYAWASIADHVVVSQTGELGSIGVKQTLEDTTVRDAAMGLKFEHLSSGDRKNDGDPTAGITEGAKIARGRIVDEMAQSFFEHVAMNRPLSTSAVAALEADILVGANAVSAGLADAVGTLDDLLAMLVGTDDNTHTGAQMPEDTDRDDREEARTALQKLAKGEGKVAAQAKAALKALNGDEDEEEKKEESKAQGDEDESDDEEESQAAASASIATQALAQVHALKAQIAARETQRERETLLASRPDFDKELREHLAASSTPIDSVRQLTKTLPRKPVSAAASASPDVRPTTGDHDGLGSSPLDPALAAQMDQAMGLGNTNTGVVYAGNVLTFGAPVPVSKKEAVNG